MATQNVNFKIKNTLEVLQDGIIHGNTTLASDATAGNLKTIILGNATDTSGQYTDINIFGDVTINGSINSSSLNSDGSIFPSSTNTVYLGDSTKKWLSLYASTVNTNTLNVRNTADEVVKFSVDGTTGNTNISGSLSITGLTTINDCVINGNVTVNGTTTTLNTATMMVDDKNIELGSTAIPTDVTADGGGITLKGNTDKTILWVDANDAWTFNQNVDISSGFAYRIGNTAVLSSTTLGASVISSSLTSVGTLSSGTWNASIIAGQYGGTGVANTGKTITLGGNLITAGAFATTLTATNTTNVTLPTSGTLATIAGTEILSGKTLTAPKIVNGGYVADANGNESIIFNTTASAVNEITVANASTGNNPSITASGTDVNVGINFIPKGTGKIQISGNEIATINSTQTLTNKTIDLGSNTLSGNVVTIGTTAITAGGTQLTLAGLTSVNGLSLTANTTGFSIAGSSKTLTINKSITLDGTDGTTITLPSSTGTVPLNDQTMYIGTTAVTINRASASLALTGISSIDGSASSLTTARTINGEPFDGSANINIEARLGTPIASATTTTIGTKGSGDTIHITGTATITSLGVSTTGTIRRLVFDGAVTLAHNATSLILPAGDSLTTFVGDVADFVCENGELGYWRCLNYAVANISQQEYSYLNGATSNIQTQLDAKAPIISPTFTGTVTLPSTTSIGAVSSAELSYLDGVTAPIQPQLDAKAPLASPGLTGTPTAPTATTGTNTTQVATTAFVRQELAGFSGGGLPTNSQTFTSSGTFTVPTGVSKVMVSAHGGGGGGGGGYGTSITAGGGGGVGFIPQIINVTSGQAITVIIGSGGAGGLSGGGAGAVGGSTFFGSTEFKGGNGGGQTFGGMSLFSGGAAKQKGSNSSNYSGGAIPTNTFIGGGGGAGSGGNGGQAGGVNSSGMSQNGQAGQGYGAGGGGGAVMAVSGSPYCIGGAGYQGILIVNW
jgi:hypothetical protein